MKKTIAFILVLFSSFLGLSQGTDYYKEFLNGTTNKFTCDGSGKCLGLKFSIKYPQNWTSKDGNRPHVVTILREGANPVMAMIIVMKNEREFTSGEIQEALSQKSLIANIVELGTYKTCSTNLKIDGLPAASAEYIVYGQTDNIEMELHTIGYNIYYKSWMIMLQFCVGGYKGKSGLSEKFEQNKSFFKVMANSFVVINQYE